MDIFNTLHNIIVTSCKYLASLNWPLLLLIGFVIGIILLVITKHHKKHFIAKHGAQSVYTPLRFPGFFMKNKAYGVDLADIGLILTLGCAIFFYMAFIFYEIDRHL